MDARFKKAENKQRICHMLQMDHIDGKQVSKTLHELCTKAGTDRGDMVMKACKASCSVFL